MAEDDESRPGPRPEGNEFEELFQRIQSLLDQLVARLRAVSASDDLPHPFVYGFQIKVDREGRPQVEEFGDLLPSADSPGLREPLADLVEDDSHVALTVELPGVRREEIELRCEPRRIIVSVGHPGHRYYKEATLESPVEPASAKVTFTNGVLDIVLAKLRPGQA